MPVFDETSFLHADPGSQIEQLWTEQLYREYDHIQFTYRVALRPAVIRVAVLENKWGLWDSSRRCILMSRRLIEEYPWDVVIEVLKHEMAHQLVSEKMAGARPHGPEFLQACGKLGVAQWAISASGELPRTLGDWKARAMSVEEERLLKRVEKLLALAGSANEHESLLAMHRVQQMYAKYNLERVRCQGVCDMVYLLINPRKKRIDSAQSMIGSILAEHFFVRIIYGRLFDARDLCHYSVIELLGTKQNVLMAEYVHGFLSQQSLSLWKDYQRLTGKRGRSRRSYVMGVLSGFSEKLRAVQNRSEVAQKSEVEIGECRALMRVADQQLESYVGHRHPRLVSRSWGGGAREVASFQAGHEQGRKLSLHRPISESQGNRGRLLRAREDS